MFFFSGVFFFSISFLVPVGMAKKLGLAGRYCPIEEFIILPCSIERILSDTLRKSNCEVY